MTNTRAVELFRSYLSKGRNGNWVWETAVEDAAEALGIRHDNDLPAVMKCGRCLRELWPSATSGKSVWEAMDLDQAAEAAVELTAQTFAELGIVDLVQYDTSARTRMQNRVGRLPEGPLRSLSELAIEQPFLRHDDDRVSNGPGIYLQWRAKNHGSLVYIGEAVNVRKRIADEKRQWWGEGRPMYVKHVTHEQMSEGSLRRDIESAMMEVLEAPSQIKRLKKGKFTWLD